MGTRYKVVRQNIRFNKQTYHTGEFLPESFSERDLYKVLYPSRIEKVQIPDSAPVVLDTVATNQGSIPARTPAAPIKTTGASLSGKSIIKK